MKFKREKKLPEKKFQRKFPIKIKMMLIKIFLKYRILEYKERSLKRLMRRRTSPKIFPKPLFHLFFQIKTLVYKF